jgi:hypothetical protein
MASIMFNAAEVQPSSFEAIPTGTYEAVISNSESRPMKSGNGMGFNLEFEIISGECKGRKVFAWITFEHRTSPDAQRIGREQLSAICRAVGVTQLNDTAQLHNLPLLIVVALDKNDPTRNIIKGFKAVKSVGAGAAAPQAAPQNQGAPWARR